MLKKSILLIPIIILSCILTTSCRSSSKTSDSSLVTLTFGKIPSSLNDTVKKLRVIALSQESKCTKLDKKIIILGSTTEDTKSLKKSTDLQKAIDNSFKHENNFINTFNNPDDTISLYSECLPYEVSIAYWCKESKIDGTKYDSGLCFKGSEKTGTKAIDNKITLQISLKGQGSWTSFTGITTTTQINTKTKLADLFPNCFIKDGENYKYLKASDTKSTFLYPILSSECSFTHILQQNKIGNVSISAEKGDYTILSPFSDENIFNTYKNNNIMRINTINATSLNISTQQDLNNTLNTVITTKSEIYMINIPKSFPTNSKVEADKLYFSPTKD